MAFGISEVAAAWAMGELAFKGSIQKYWIRGKINSRRRKVFHDVWAEMANSMSNC